MSNPIRAWPYKIGGGRSVGVGDRQASKRGKSRERRGKDKEGSVKELHSGFSLPTAGQAQTSRSRVGIS